MQTWTSALLTRVLTKGLVTIFRMRSVVPVILAGWEQDVKLVTILRDSPLFYAFQNKYFGSKRSFREKLPHYEQ